MPMHCYEYTNALGWFFDNFDHPRRLRLLYIAAEFVNMTARHQRLLGEMEPRAGDSPQGAKKLSANALLERVVSTAAAQEAEASQAWLTAYLEATSDREALVQALAILSSRIGNDPHNQEIPQTLLEDYRGSASPRKEVLLRACIQHCAGHRKYGDFLEASRRFGEALAMRMRPEEGSDGPLQTRTGGDNYQTRTLKATARFSPFSHLFRQAPMWNPTAACPFSVAAGLPADVLAVGSPRRAQASRAQNR